MKKIFFAIIVLVGVAVLMPSIGRASLTFTPSSTNNVNIGTNAGLSNASWTVMEWVYRTGSQNNGCIFCKGTFGTQTRNPAVSLRGNDGVTPNCIVDRATTDANSTADNASADTIPTSTWEFIVATYTEANGCKLYRGTLATSAIEFTSAGYVARTIGVGATQKSALDNTIVGNGNGASTPFPGVIAVVAYWNRAMSLQEIRSQQFGIHPSQGIQSLNWLGYNGTGVQADYSGNKNNGTVTGATASRNAPILPTSQQ